MKIGVLYVNDGRCIIKYHHSAVMWSCRNMACILQPVSQQATIHLLDRNSTEENDWWLCHAMFYHYIKMLIYNHNDKAK